VKGRLSVLLVAAAVVLGPAIDTGAQPAARPYRVGFLTLGGSNQDDAFWEPLRQRLRERGWVEGQNLVIERRYADGRSERLAELAADLLRLAPDVLVTRGGPATMVAKRATTTIPIVMRNTTDPVGLGAVVSLARPGGNVTGLTDDAGPEIFGKRVQLLKELAPTISVVGNLTRVRPADTGAVLNDYETVYRSHARTVGVEIRIVRLQGPDDIDKTFASIRPERIDALDVSHVPVVWAHRRQILDLALRHRIPAMYHHRQYALDGGLMTYGEDERDIPRRLAGHVDKLLRGARPADLPVEQPTKFDLVINLGTAKALGLTIPPALLRRADETIPAAD
jgi:putative ABC transport system substrate-binding protein